MKLINKLNVAKDTLLESIDEFVETADLDAEEYAQFYGASYTNFLNYIKKSTFIKVSEMESGENISIEIPIASINDKEIIFDAKEFGIREKFNLSIIKNLLYKARITWEINKEDKLMVLSLDNKERLSDRIENVLENKDEYIDKAINFASTSADKVKEYAAVGSQKAREGTKKLLRNLADYADKNL